MKLSLGQQTDTGAIDQKSGSWRGGRNAVVSAQVGAVTNEPGFDMLIDSLPGTNIGNIVLDSNLVAVFQVTEQSEIYIVDVTNGTIHLVVATDFGFDVNHPVSGEYYRNSKGQIVIAWTDDYNPPRIMNTEIDYGVAIDKLTRVYLKYQLPVLTSNSILDTGGSLHTGAYFITTAYISSDGAQTPYAPVLGPFYITDDLRANIATLYDGAKADTPTSKALSLTFNNIDTDYQYLIVTLIAKVDGVVTAKDVKKIAISIDTVTTTIQGSEDNGVVALSEIVGANDVFSRVGSMTQLNNQLFMTNLSKEEEAVLQLSALNIKVDYDYDTVDIRASDNTNPKLDPTRGWMHNEVYALYIHYVKEDGTISRGQHIPGRALAVYNNSDYPEFNGMFENTLVTAATGEHITRAVGIGGSSSKIFQFFDTADNPSATTNMQYWENGETYPNSTEFGTLASQPIRHHKFPSLAHMKSRHYSSDAEFGKSKLSRLKINVTNVSLPTGYVGYFISSAKRNFNNSTIIAQDLMLGAGQRGFSEGTDQNYWTTSGNWNIRRPSNGISFNFNYIRSHAFDLMVDKPAVSPNYVEAELVIRNRDIRLNYTTSKTSGWITMSGGLDSPKREIRNVEGLELSDDQRKQDVVVIDETIGDIAVTATAPKKRFTKVLDSKYIPNNVASGVGIYYNLNAEEFFGIHIGGSIFSDAFNGLTINTYDRIEAVRTQPQFTGGVGTSGVSEEVTYLYNIKQYKSDVYIDMFNQELYLVNSQMAIPTSPSDTITIKGGDVLVSDMSVYTHGSNATTDTDGPGNATKGIRIARRFICETVNFASFRYNDIDTFYFPQTAAHPFLVQMYLANHYNRIAYNKDYTSVDDINSLLVNDPSKNLQFNTDFPYRIIRSKIDQAEEFGINNWRTFPVNDYYEMPKHRGAITNIQAMGNELVINQKYSTFRTRNNITLATSAGAVQTGNGDIFAVTPEEMLSTKEGFAGCQHKFSCLLTAAGYFFIDAEQGKIFLLRDKLEEISRKGKEIFFFSSLSGVLDNPFTSTGFTVGWDSEYNRIILSKTNEFTMSYSLDIEEGAWAFDHDYYPTSMFHTRQGLFSFDSTGKIFKHNSSIRKGMYYDDTIYPTSIIPVFTEPRELTKYAYNIKWRSEIRNQLGGIQKTETLTQLFIYNSFQATDLIDLTLYLNPSINTYNLRKSAQVWHFNRFRDLVIDSTLPIEQNFLPISGNVDSNKPFNLKRRFIDFYLLVNFIYDNQPIDGEQRNLYLYEVDVDVKPVDR